MISTSARASASLVFALLLAAAGPASASLVGDEVACEGFATPGTPFQIGCVAFGDPISTTTNRATGTVGMGSEFQLVNRDSLALIDVNFDGDSITLSNAAPANTLAFVSRGPVLFSDLDWTGGTTGRIVGFELMTSGISTSTSPSSDGTSLTAADILFGDDFLSVNIQWTRWDIGSLASINLITEHDDNTGGGGTQPVPEPSAGLVYLAGLGLAGAITRRRQA